MRRGMAKLLEKYWPRINKTVTARLQTIGEPSYPGMGALDGIDVRDDYLGCGYWGCVWPLSFTQRWVLKVTYDPTEPAVVDIIMEDPYLHEHDGIVRYEGMWQIPELVRYKVFGNEVVRAPHIILREEVRPFRIYDEGQSIIDAGGVIRQLIAARKAEESYRKLQIAKAHDKRSVWDWEHRHRRAVDGWLNSLDSMDKIYELASVAEFLRAFYERTEAILADIHPQNLAWRRWDLWDLFGPDTPEAGRYMTIMDPGHTFMPSTPVSEYVQNPRAPLIN